MDALKRSEYNAIAKKAAKTKVVEYGKSVAKYAKDGKVPVKLSRTLHRLAANKANAEAWSAGNKAKATLEGVAKVGKYTGYAALAGATYTAAKKIMDAKKGFDADNAAQVKSEDDLYRMRMKAIKSGKGAAVKKSMK